MVRDSWRVMSAGDALLRRKLMDTLNGPSAAWGEVAVLELQRDVGPNVRVLLVAEAVATVCASMTKMLEAQHEITFVQHGVGVLHEPHMWLSGADNIQSGASDAVRMMKISDAAGLSGRVFRAGGEAHTMSK
jgi:hypothetical protein